MAFLVQRSDVGEFRRRYRWMVLFVLATFAVLIGRLVQLQIIEGDSHRAESRRNIIRQTTLATSRGVIRDGYGKVLAGNRPSYNVYVVPGTDNLLEMAGDAWKRSYRRMGTYCGKGIWLYIADDVCEGLSFSKKSLWDFGIKGIGRDYAETSESLGEEFKTLDISDSLAAAICASYRLKELVAS